MRVLLVHWNEAEAGLKMKALEKLGFEAFWFGKQGEARMKHIKELKPDAILIDLTRLPYLGRYVAEAARKAKGTREIPVVFVEVAGWKTVGAALGKARVEDYVPIAHPESPLAKKLNLSPGRKVYLRDAPREFFTALTEVPEGVEFLERPAGAEMAMLFFESWDGLMEDWDRVCAMARKFPIWIVYRKGALKANEIRAALKDSGLADYKVCSITPQWTGILATVARKR